MICPSRGRPENVDRLITAWSLLAGTADLMIALDDDDPELDHYRDVVRNGALLLPDQLKLHVGPRERLGPTLNTVALREMNHYGALGFLGDDHVPRTVGFDVELERALRTSELAYGNDLLQGAMLPTAIVMTSRLVRTLGWMVPPGLVHLYIDNAWLDLGRELGITYLPDVVIEHMHPVNGKAEWDVGYREVNSGEQTTADGNAYHRWRANSLAADVARVREVLGAEAAASVPDA